MKKREFIVFEDRYECLGKLRNVWSLYVCYFFQRKIAYYMDGKWSIAEAEEIVRMPLEDFRRIEDMVAIRLLKRKG